MKFAHLFIFCMALTGCAQQQVAREGTTLPFKAIVVFNWDDAADSRRVGNGGGADERPAGTAEAAAGDQVAGGGAPPDAHSSELSRQEVEDAILDGLDEYQVFSDFRATERPWAREVAASEKADLILQVQMGDLAKWSEDSSQIVPGPAILDTLLWISTGIGSWWIGDQEYPTQSEVGIGWSRAEKPASKSAGDELRTKERIAGGQYRLSFWERSKPWRAPLPYLLSIVVPPPFIPLKDPREVDRSLQASALKDLKRELAVKLKGGSIGAGGAPFLFLLQQPRNGSAVEGYSARLVYRYQLQQGFEEHEATRLGALAVYVKPGNKASYELRRTYSGDQLRSINEKISRDQEIEEEIDGLSPGLNLIRFTAKAELDKQPITNTVAIHCR